MRILTAFLLISLVLPSWAQLYSYRAPDGKLVITDRPIKDKEFKLKDVYVPPRLKQAQAEEQDRLAGEKPGPALSATQLVGLVHPIAKAMKVDPRLVRAVIDVESNGNPRAKSKKGAMGLMQLIPETAERFGISNPWDPRQNVRGGVSYLRWLLSYFEGDVDLVLAAYNAGENAVDRFGGVPPYRETREYVAKIRRHYSVKDHPFDPGIKHRSSLVRQKKAAAQVEAKQSEAKFAQAE